MFCDIPRYVFLLFLQPKLSVNLNIENKAEIILIEKLSYNRTDHVSKYILKATVSIETFTSCLTIPCFRFQISIVLLIEIEFLLTHAFGK